MTVTSVRNDITGKLSAGLAKVKHFFRATLKKINKALKPFRKNNWFMLLIILTYGLTQLALLWRPVVGIYCNAATLAILIGVALWRRQLRQLAISTAILPVASMVALSLPQTTAFAEITVYYATILVLGLIYRYMFTLEYPQRETHLTPREYGFAIPVMLVIGQVLGVIGYVILRHRYPFDGTSLPLVAVTVVVYAIAEETLFRGLIQQTASQVMHPLMAGILASTLFVFASIDSMSIRWPLYALLISPVLAFTYYKRNNVVLTIAINAMAKLTYIGLLASFVFR